MTLNHEFIILNANPGSILICGRRHCRNNDLVMWGDFVSTLNTCNNKILQYVIL